MLRRHRIKKLKIWLLIFVIFVVYEVMIYIQPAPNLLISNFKAKIGESQFMKKSFILKHSCDCPVFKNEFIHVQMIETDSFNSTLQKRIFINMLHLAETKSTFTSVSLFDLPIEDFNKEILTCDVYNILKRGKHQKVIAYSLYGNDSRYFQNIEQLVELVKEKYKNYTVRIYYDDSVNNTLRCELECKYSPVLDFCNINRFSTNGLAQMARDTSKLKDLDYMHKMMWRFLPMGDTFVDIHMSRDIDSLILDREVESVNEWLNSENFGHIMRG